MRSWKLAVAVVALASTAAITGCGDDNNSGPEGPEITFFGLTRADDSLVDSAGTSSSGAPIFIRPKTIGSSASGFSIVIEGKPGTSDSPVGESSYDQTLGQLPDLQIVVSQPLGDGSTRVCDDPIDTPGGVPAVDPASFDATEPSIVNAGNDLGCRFVDGAGLAEARTDPDDSCVSFPSGDFAFVNDGSTAQFCGFVNVPLAFPSGDTVVTARLRDTAGNLGPEKKIVVRVQ